MDNKARSYFKQRIYQRKPYDIIPLEGFGDIAQLGERGVRNAEVGGSSPPISTTVLSQLYWVFERGHT